MASTNPSIFFGDGPKSPIRTNIGGLRESASDYSPQAQTGYRQQEQNPLQIKDAISEIGSNIKYLYSLNDQIRGIEDYSSTFFKWLVKTNYFLHNGVFLDARGINDIVAKKRELRNTDKRVLKTVAYQPVSDYLAFINYSSKIYLIKASSLDVFQSFDLKDTIQAINFHPYKKLWLAVATRNQVKILCPETETDQENFYSLLHPQPQRETDQSFKKLDRYLTLDVVCTSLEFSPDGRFLAMINEHSNVITVWDFTAQKLSSHFEFGTVFSQMKWSPDGAYLAVSSDKFRSLYIYEVFTWQKQKWNFKAPVNQMEWKSDASTLYVFLKETLEIKAIMDVQLDKCKTAYERKEVEFIVSKTYKLRVDDYREIQMFTFCFESDRLRYAYIISTISDSEVQEITKLGVIIDQTNEEKICEIAERRQPVRALFFIVRANRVHDQGQPILYKCYSKDEIENIKL